MRDVKHCSDFFDDPDFPGCCGSCHDDYDEYGYDLCGGDYYMVCCSVATWLNGRGVDIYE